MKHTWWLWWGCWTLSFGTDSGWQRGRLFRFILVFSFHRVRLNFDSWNESWRYNFGSIKRLRILGHLSKTVNQANMICLTWKWKHWFDCIFLRLTVENRFNVCTWLGNNRGKHNPSTFSESMLTSDTLLVLWE